MIKKTINRERIEGRVYQHDLKIKTVQNRDSKNYGKEFIGGKLYVATDESGLNVIDIHFSYVTPLTKKNQTNLTYNVLKSIIEGNKTWLTVGKDEATMVRVDTSLSVNDFYNNEGILVSAKAHEGGFVSIVNSLNENENVRSRFNTDILITNVSHVEADPDKGIQEDYAKVSGMVFDFKNALQPVDLVVRDPNGISYFEGLEASEREPIFTRVEGNIVSKTISKAIETDGAFGKTVRKVERNIREWVIDWASPNPYSFGDDDVMTVEDLQKARQDREIHLAETKQSYESRMTNRGNAMAAAPTPTPATMSSIPAGQFSF